MLEVAGLFFAFRALVMANPLWYPALDVALRARLFRFIHAVLDEERFDPARANDCA